MFSPTSVSSPNYSSFKGLRVSRNVTLETAAESPLEIRKRSVEKRFNRIQAVVDAKEARARNDQLEAHIRQVDERITQNYEKTENKYRAFAKDVARLEENVAAEIIARELLEERSIKELTVVESNLCLELQNEKELNRESQRALNSQIDSKIRGLREDFTQEQARINGFKEEKFNFISAEMVELQQGLQKEQQAREQVHEALFKSMTNNVNRLRDTLVVERKFRVETEDFLYTKIEEISASLKRQIDSEREKQEREEAHLLTLLEEVCNRFEDHFVAYRG